MISLQVWSDDLANIAARNACQCNFQYTDLPPIPYKQPHARENHIYYPAINLGSMVAYWYQEHVDYNFIHGQCYQDSICEHYLNVSSYCWCPSRPRNVHISCTEKCTSVICFFSLADGLGPSM